MSAGNRTSKRAVIMLQEQQMVLEMRRMGHSYTQICDTMKISRYKAHQLVLKAMADAKVQVNAQAIELRAEDVSRLDGLLSIVWPKARAGSLEAVDRVIRIMERRAALLGLDAPKRVEATGKDGAPIEVQHSVDLKLFSREELYEMERITAVAEQRGHSETTGEDKPH